MKNIYTALAIVCAAQLGAATTATLSLKDGSTLKGEFKAERIDCSAAFAKEMPLDPSIVKSLTFAGTNGEAKVVLSNGDRLTITVSNPDFPVSSVLGELKIPLANIRSMNLSTIKPGAASGELVFHCTFDDEASVKAPVAGPSGILKGGHFTQGKDYNALFVPQYTSCARFELPEGTIGPAGTIEFWGQAENGPFTTGGCPRFFEILAAGATGEISQDWSTNNGSGGNGLTFRINGLTTMATSQWEMLSETLRTSTRPLMMGPPHGWHHYALVWDAKGLNLPSRPSAAVFLDGRLLMSTSSPGWQGPSALFGASTLFFPSREDEMPGYAKRAYAIDDFKIWSHAKTQFDLN